jgi:hypothetical protein
LRGFFSSFFALNPRSSASIREKEVYPHPSRHFAQRPSGRSLFNYAHFFPADQRGLARIFSSFFALNPRSSASIREKEVYPHPSRHFA